jgi:hypothetical protein
MSEYYWQERGYVVMEIAPVLQDEFERLNKDQRAIVSHEKWQLLVIAGPGSVKRFVCLFVFFATEKYFGFLYINIYIIWQKLKGFIKNGECLCIPFHR